MLKKILLLLLCFNVVYADELYLAIRRTDLAKVTQLIAHSDDKKNIKLFHKQLADTMCEKRKNELSNGEFWDGFGFSAPLTSAPGVMKYALGGLLNACLFLAAHKITTEFINKDYSLYVLSFVGWHTTSAMQICLQRMHDLSLNYLKQRYEDALKIREKINLNDS